MKSSSGGFPRGFATAGRPAGPWGAPTNLATHDEKKKYGVNKIGNTQKKAWRQWRGGLFSASISHEHTPSASLTLQNKGIYRNKSNFIWDPVPWVKRFNTFPAKLLLHNFSMKDHYVCKNIRYITLPPGDWNMPIFQEIYPLASGPLMQAINT